ncbi:MAG: alpha-D-glucose phosphate-specific phosphoglucomutase [Bdellovibrionales bacterium]|nr:alpha-D-glucose phosphate-specific phosphoglucomutase [Oligoflexia bacterium]
MALSPLAGLPAPANLLIDIQALQNAYFSHKPNLDDPTQLVSFGTSGHRGSALHSTYTEAHVLAITQAICDYRKTKNIHGPLFLGMDTHALSDPSQQSALEVLAANGVITLIQQKNGFTPTPVISHAILVYNRKRETGFADGIVITPSHNPPEDGGFKYNPPHGGPADSDITNEIQKLANQYLRNQNRDVKRMPHAQAMKASTTKEQDYVRPYLNDLKNVIDMDRIKDSKLKMAVDPLGGAAVHYWEPMAELYGLDLTVVNKNTDPKFSFMTVDHDGKIRMDCSSPYAMASLVKLKDSYALAFGNDPDCDRHGIITPQAGLMNPNHYLSVAIQYLIQNRPQWNAQAQIGKTVVSSSMIDRVVKNMNRRLYEVPVGFKWFAPGLYDQTVCFGGEESAGASFLRLDGSVWTTDKDGMILNLLAAEMTAKTGQNPSEHYEKLTASFGDPVYLRLDNPATTAEKKKLGKLSPASVKQNDLAGEPILAKLTEAPGNQASIGGLKCVTENGWFAARPSGTENIYKIYAESFKGQAHLNLLVDEAKGIVADALEP